MEDPELSYCDVRNTVKEVQPLPPPRSNRDSIPASFIEVNPPRRIPPPETLTVITNSSERGSRNSISRKQVVLAIAVGILAILSTVFVTLYFAPEVKCKPCDCQNNLGNKENTSCNDDKKKPCVCKNCSLVSNCSKFNISTISGKNTVPKSCSDIYKKGGQTDGIYIIDPDGLGAFNVSCDMTTSGGGWTVFQRRVDGSIDFYLGWDVYKKGFGDLNGEFWLGLDKIHRLSKSGQNVLKVDLEDFENETRYADYSTFAVANEGDKYRLTVGGYSGNAGDSLSRHNGMKFTTKDADNDVHSGTNCAVDFKGAWWYRDCHHSNLNGKYLRGPHSSTADGVNWLRWKGYRYSLKKTKMKIRRRSF